MTRYVDSFDSLNLQKWFVLTGRGFQNRYYVEKSKLCFNTCYGRIIGDGNIAFRTAMPLSIMNNKFSVEVELDPHSFGSVYLLYSPNAAEIGMLPWSVVSSDSIAFTMHNQWGGCPTGCKIMRIRDGGVQFYQYVALEDYKTRAKLAFENKNGVSRFLVDDKVVSEFATEFKVAYIYLVAEPEMDNSGARRSLIGSFDNFTIEDYELAQTAPELVSMMPTLVSVSQATLTLLIPITLISLVRGTLG
jgi:hypothetical protein